ncbi:hypothetical protein DPMN_053453 [Dreissena polymorpha]|uniref:Uncharacterized protein n=1 Tax=Dreissena polymorpha TaxID=45954 RepID=A0A9D4CMT5_DREPO|nr:hypothetical protein DPMN_053453 [Dreissena polymorpha]
MQRTAVEAENMRNHRAATSNLFIREIIFSPHNDAKGNFGNQIDNQYYEELSSLLSRYTRQRMERLLREKNVTVLADDEGQNKRQIEYFQGLLNRPAPANASETPPA